MMSRRNVPNPSFLAECWNNVYADHYLQTLRDKESKRPITTLQSKQLKYRGYLILKLQRVASRLDLGSRILHAGVQILDAVMDAFNVDEDRLMHLALICLLLATKFEVKGVNIPRFSELCRVADVEFITHSELWELEFHILQHLKWDLSLPTAATFVDFFSPFALTREDYNEWMTLDPRNKIIPFEKLRLHFKNKVKAFMQLTLSCMKFAQAVPSLVAAGCLQASRSSYGLNCWNNTLEKVTNYEADIVISYSKTLIKMMTSRQYTPLKRKHTDSDSGYSSPELDSKRIKIYQDS